jgi:hypothetical protein
MALAWITGIASGLEFSFNPLPAWSAGTPLTIEVQPLISLESDTPSM